MKVLDLANKAAARYAAKCWWAERDELRGAALLAGVEARRTFDPAVGVDEGAYMWRAMVLACRNTLWAASSPVSNRHRPSELAGLFHAELSDEMVDATVGPYGEVAEAEWCTKVQEHVQALAHHRGHELAVPVVLGQATPAEVAQANGVPVTRVYRARQYLKEAIANDLTLFNLWKDATT